MEGPEAVRSGGRQVAQWEGAEATVDRVAQWEDRMAAETPAALLTEPSAHLQVVKTQVRDAYCMDGVCWQHHPAEFELSR